MDRNESWGTPSDGARVVGRRDVLRAPPLKASLAWTLLSKEALKRAEARLREDLDGVRDEIGFLPLHQARVAPWWVFPAGSIKRYVFEVPASEQRHWLKWVREQRRLYRLVLGQPNQEDLVEVLTGHDGIMADDVRSNAINLSPWFSSRPWSR
jgi:hypothetical protein